MQTWFNHIDHFSSGDLISWDMVASICFSRSVSYERVWSKYNLKTSNSNWIKLNNRHQNNKLITCNMNRFVQFLLVASSQQLISFVFHLRKLKWSNLMHLKDLEDLKIDSETCSIYVQSRLNFEFRNKQLRNEQDWDWMKNSVWENEKIDFAVGENFYSIS